MAAVFKPETFWHGGDYNPDQWLDRPEILEEDIRLMKKAGVNMVSVGIFAWALLEPQEGVYNFGWLRNVIDNLYANGISVLLATPSGARPVWMSMKYPEVLRVENGVRNLHGGRHNHCYTSPVYRSFVNKMNTRLAEEFGSHPAVKGWHISNEYGGECHCEYCREAFRGWLKNRYKTIDNLNKAWWTNFWSKTFSDWSEICSPEKNGEGSLSGLSLSWRRFCSDQTRDFIAAEAAPIKRICPDKPVTINTMGFFYMLDYASFDGTVDFFGYDSYPAWHDGDDLLNAAEFAFTYDYVRGFNGKNWSLMESTPSQVNWHPVCKLKRPKMHMLSSMQAVAHGSDTVMMFQWRKGRGGPEKFHGAVIGHDGTGDTRTFRDVAEVGETLKNLAPLVNAEVNSKAALIYDQENRWALDICQGPLEKKEYHETLREHYMALTRQGINVDVISSDKSFEKYSLIVAPYLYMLKDGVAERLDAFVKNGGKLVLTYMAGKVDKDDLCFFGTDTFVTRTAGVFAEETDALYPGQKNSIIIGKEYPELEGEYPCGFICDVIYPRGAETVGVYGSDFYKGQSALTVNRLEKGECWYIAARAEVSFLSKLYDKLSRECGIIRAAEKLPVCVNACMREKDGFRYTFLMNFSEEAATAMGISGISVPDGQEIKGSVTLEGYGVKIVREPLV